MEKREEDFGGISDGLGKSSVNVDSTVADQRGRTSARRSNKSASFEQNQKRETTQHTRYLYEKKNQNVSIWGYMHENLLRSRNPTRFRSNSWKSARGNTFDNEGELIRRQSTDITRRTGEKTADQRDQLLLLLVRVVGTHCFVVGTIIVPSP